MLLNESQQRRLLANARYADRLLSDIEGILSAAESKSPFHKYRPDLSLHQARLTRSYLGRFRDHLTRVLETLQVAPDVIQFSSLHSIRVTLTFVRISVEEMAPQYLRGYGELSADAETQLHGMCSELEGLVDVLERNLLLGEAGDLQSRLERLERTSGEAELLRALDRITGEHELAEFRGVLVNLVEKMETHQFEIAVFGRVSSGKSSLLNHILGSDVLPVGVNPITAVPTRLLFGEASKLVVTFTDRKVREYSIDEIAQFASEEQNPGNRLGIVRLVAYLPSARLKNGLVLVDTPGLGALATAGAQETISYLPQSDLGIVLLSSMNPINDEDLQTIAALARAGTPAMVLLSKADLLSQPDQEKAARYAERAIQENLGLAVRVHPVSTASSHHALLEGWFEDQLAPVYRRYRELAERSVRRKLGATREAVIAALRAKLGRSTGAATTGQNGLEEAERALRAAAAEIEGARRFCLDASDDVRLLDRIAMARAVDAVMKAWNSDGFTMGVEIVQGEAESVALEAGRQIGARLQGVAQKLDAALAATNEVLGQHPDGSEPSLGTAIREMPRFEATLPAVTITAPWFRKVRPLAANWARSKLSAADLALEAAFTNYSRGLQVWSREVIATLQRDFDARADGCRAQLRRLAGRGQLDEKERAQVEANLCLLEQWDARESASAVMQEGSRP